MEMQPELHVNCCFTLCLLLWSQPKHPLMRHLTFQVRCFVPSVFHVCLAVSKWDKPGTKQHQRCGVPTRSAIKFVWTDLMPFILPSSSGRQPQSLFNFVCVVVGVSQLEREWKENLNKKIWKKLREWPHFEPGCVHLPCRWRKVWRGAPGGHKGDMVNRRGGGGVKQDPHTKPGIISVAPPLLWETWLNAPLQEHYSVKATVLSYSFIWIASGMRQRTRKRQRR